MKPIITRLRSDKNFIKNSMFGLILAIVKMFDGIVLLLSFGNYIGNLEMEYLVWRVEHICKQHKQNQA